MIINKAILHIFDFISEVCIFSQKEIDLREDNINEFIKNHKVIFDYLFKSSYMPV